MNRYKSFGSENDEFTNVAGPAKKGELNLAFIDMGQGDCTVISTPDNSVIVVDCGSTSGLPPDSFTELKKLVRAWAKGKKVDLVLTHPDADHYNQVLNLCCYDLPVIEFENIFFSVEGVNSPMGNYTQSGLNINMAPLGNPDIHCVTINDTKNEYTSWYVIDDYDTGNIRKLTNPYYAIKTGKYGSKNWAVSIIAGNVDDYGNDFNASSLVTLVEYGTDKVLLTGDSDQYTMAYLYGYQKAEITNLAVIQIPHHGSESGFPDDNFIKTTCPQALSISVGILNDSYNLPRWSVIDKWVKKSTCLRKDPSTIDYWKDNSSEPKYNTHAKLVKLYDNWVSIKVPFLQNNSGTFFWLADPNDISKTKTAFYGFTNNGFFIYRSTIPQDVYQTGVKGSYELGFK